MYSVSMSLLLLAPSPSDDHRPYFRFPKTPGRFPSRWHSAQAFFSLFPNPPLAKRNAFCFDNLCSAQPLDFYTKWLIASCPLTTAGLLLLLILWHHGQLQTSAEFELIYEDQIHVLEGLRILRTPIGWMVGRGESLGNSYSSRPFSMNTFTSRGSFFHCPASIKSEKNHSSLSLIPNECW